MIHTLKCAAGLSAPMAAIVVALATPAFSQAPTDAQRNAIRSACRSDYQAHCASVTPGGAEALQCLQKNMSSLSSACQTAVRAVEPPAAPKAEAAPAAAPKAEAAPAAAPSKAELAPAAAPAKPAAATAAPPVPPKAAASTPAKKPSDTQKPSAPATAATASPAAAPAAAPAPALVLRPMLPREELFVLRSACSGDVGALCGGVAPGGGRIMQCLSARAASLSPACKDVLAQFAAR